MVTKGKQRKITFKMVSVVDYATPLAGLTVSTKISKDGGEFALTALPAVEVGSGWYSIVLGDEEMNADELILTATAEGAAQSDRLILTDLIEPTLTDMMGPGYNINKHSLAMRPSGSSGGGGGCAWWDTDIALAREFFQKFPKQFVSFKDNFETFQSKVDTNDSLVKIADSMSTNGTQFQAQLKQVVDAIQKLQEDMAAAEKLLLHMADVETLQEALNE